MSLSSPSLSLSLSLSLLQHLTLSLSISPSFSLSFPPALSSFFFHLPLSLSFSIPLFLSYSSSLFFPLSFFLSLSLSHSLSVCLTVMIHNNNVLNNKLAVLLFFSRSILGHLRQCYSIYTLVRIIITVGQPSWPSPHRFQPSTVGYKIILHIIGRKEMFYLTTHSTLFIYSYMASNIW